LVAEKELDVRVEKNTDLKGGIIASKSGDLTLDTGTLTFSDIQDHDKQRNTGGGVNVSIGFDENGNVGTPGGSVEFTDAKKDKEQITRATVGEGTLTIRDEADQKALEEEGKTENVASLNRDLDKAQEITRDEESYIGVSLNTQTVVWLAEGLSQLADKLVEAGKISAKQREILAKVARCGGRQSYNHFNPLNWLVTPAYAETDCSDVNLDRDIRALDQQTLEALIEHCKDPQQKAEAQRLLAWKIYGHLDKSDIAKLNGMSKWDFSDLKDVKSVTNLSPEALRFVFLVAETIDGCKGSSCEIVRGLYNDYGVDSHILHNATFLNKTPPDKSPTLGIDTKGWTWQEYLALVYAETYSSEVAGAGVGTVLAKVGAKFGSAIVNRIGNIVKSRLASNSGAGGRFTPTQPLDASGQPILRTNSRSGILVQPNGSVTCGQHACGMVLNTQGRPVAVDDIIRTRGPDTPKGTTIIQLQRALRDNGVGSTFEPSASIADLRRYTSNGRPAIATVRTGPNTGHAVVVDGVTKRGGQQVVAIRDPLGPNTVNGGVYYETVSSFQGRFTGGVIRINNQ
jgi:hypothetical protein